MCSRTPYFALLSQIVANTCPSSAALTEVVPEEGSVIKLVFFDLSEIIEAKRARYQFVGLPRRIFDDDQLITFTVYVANNITGEHSKYEIDSIVGENLADILTRAWKDPNIDFR